MPKGFSNQIPEHFTVNFQEQTVHLDNNRDLTPSDPDVFTPTLTEVSFGEFSVPNMIPMIPDISTPTLSVLEFGDNNETACSDSCEESSLIEDGDLDNSFLLQKYIYMIFLLIKMIWSITRCHILKDIRTKNVNIVLIGHLIVNFIAAKLDAIKLIIPGNTDIMVFGETKLVASYPMAQLLMPGFGMPFRLDSNAYGGGLLIYVRYDIPVNKWINTSFQRILAHIYTQTYEKFLLIGEFNAEEKENTLSEFLDLYDLKILVKQNTCFKFVENPSCVDLFLTNSSRYFQNTNVISTGISDCHKMIITVLKTTR